MCLACEQDAIWIEYLHSRGLLNPDDPEAIEKLFSAFPVQPLPLQAQPPAGSGQDTPALKEPAKEANRPVATAPRNPFSCDDPTAE